jgi:hypothetical protein
MVVVRSGRMESSPRCYHPQHSIDGGCDTRVDEVVPSRAALSDVSPARCAAGLLAAPEVRTSSPS